MEGGVVGFSWDVTITAPDGTTTAEPLKGFSNDIEQLIDPETGMAVTGRLASVALRIGHLAENGFAIPSGTLDSTSEVWLVQFLDINGEAHTFHVQKSNPDRALGLVTLLLGAYGSTA